MSNQYLSEVPTALMLPLMTPSFVLVFLYNLEGRPILVVTAGLRFLCLLMNHS